jgi:GNAT superfamily N-acetyltransferase
MVLVRETTLEEWEILRNIRLEALVDSPDFFGSTHADQLAITEIAWRESIARGGTFFAYTSGSNGTLPSGLVGGLHEVPNTVELVSLWVRPKARGQGVGQALVRAVMGWARERRATRVHLWLTDTNEPARLLYQRCGFTLTGESQPLPSNPE